MSTARRFDSKRFDRDYELYTKLLNINFIIWIL